MLIRGSVARQYFIQNPATSAVIDFIVYNLSASFHAF